MDKVIQNNEEMGFLEVGGQRERAARIEQLFTKAVGDEAVAKREESIKHFDLGSNRFQAVVYSEPVHYRESKNGEWQDIDNTLVETVTAQGRSVFRNRANRIHVEFPVKADGGNMASITDGERTFAWRFEQEMQPIRAKTRTGAEIKQERLVKQAQKMAKYAGRTVESLALANLSEEIETAQERRGDIVALKSEATYENVLPGVSVRYTMNSARVKEDIILESAEALKRAALRLPKCYNYEVTEGKQLLVKDKETGEVVFTMETPVVYDAAGSETIADVVLTDCGEYTRMEYVIDEAFMAEAQFPVTIDPIIKSSNPTQNIQDTTLGEGSTLKPYQENHLKIGKYNGSVRCVGLFKFNKLAIPKASDTIISAVLTMCPKNAPASNYIGAYEVKKPWDSSKVYWAIFNPDNADNVGTEALECVAGSTSSWLAFDLTNLYRKWCTQNAAGVSNNNGVAFRTPDNISGNNYSEIYSSDANSSYKPVMYVNYISHAGIESWWEYEDMSAGRAGTVHSDLFNGNMVLEHTDTEMLGNRMPVSVTHYYNSCLSSANSYNCGFGWKTDAHQKVTLVTHNSTNYFVWEDGDGTEHFFEWSGSQPYKDSEGMDMELTYSSSGAYIIISDKEHNQMRFNVLEAGLAWLSIARDACDNRVTYSYVSGYEKQGRIDKITDPAGRVTQFFYSGDLISSIRTPSEVAGGYRYIYFTYDSSKRLTGVRYSELGGTTVHTTYSYDGTSNLLTQARNYDGIQVNVGYEATSLYGSDGTDESRRVISMETVATSSSGGVVKYGAKQLLNYENMCTVVTAVDGNNTVNNKSLYYQFNDSGNVVSVRDDLGYARFTKFNSSLENRPSEETGLRRAVVNLLRHPDLSADWVASGNAVKDTSVTCLGMPSVKLTAVLGESRYRQQVTLKGNTKYTFSAYMRTQDVEGVFGAYLRLTKSGTLENVCSDDYLYGSTAPETGNGLATDGWHRVCVTFNHTADIDELYEADMILAADSGTVWFACPQLEIGAVMNSVNVLSNSDFNHTVSDWFADMPADWTRATNTLLSWKTGVLTPGVDNQLPRGVQGNLLSIEGVPNKTQVGFVQTVDMKGKKGDLFTLGGWINSHSVPTGSIDMRLALLLRVKKTNGSWGSYQTFKFNSEWVGWQFGCFAAAASDDYQQIEITISYIMNCNVSEFTNVFLYREAFGESFAYDSDKNLIAVGNLAGQKSDIKYDSAKNMTSYTQPGRDASVSDNQYWFYYGSTDAEKKKHLQLRSRTPMHVTDYCSFDSYGNTTANRRLDYRVFTGSTADNAYPFIRTESTYTSDGNFTAASKDARGNAVTRVFDVNDGTLKSVTDAAGQTVNYAYDPSKQVTNVQASFDGKTHKNVYTYENDRVKTVSHNTTNDNPDVVYSFGYDELGRKTTVKIGAQTLSTNVYEATRNGLLSEIRYGNGDKVGYSYDEFDRLTDVRYDGETDAHYHYEYGANGETAEVTDNVLERVERSDYDLADRLCQTELHEGHETLESKRKLLYRSQMYYDKLNNLTYFSEEANGVAYKTQFSYDRDNRMTDITYDDGSFGVSYTYDELGRVKTRMVTTGIFGGAQTSTFGYASGGYGANSTTPIVTSITRYGESLEYAYDSRGNIVSAKRGDLTTTYSYDALSRLIRVNDPYENSTWVFTYDQGGNITSKLRYAYTTGSLGTVLETIPYAYGDANWKDKLTAFNGVSLTYDAIGNPLSDGIWKYKWQAGRQLKQMSAEGRAVSFKYNHNGVRVQKIVEHDWYPVVTDYIMHDKLLSHMVVNYVDWDEVEQQDNLHFFYDADSRPSVVDFNGIKYHYIHNLQGDIIGLLDEDGMRVVEYHYDAWGKLLSTSGVLADTLGVRNPFRYRGYIYDEETELYLIDSRYYSPKLSRFISPDEYSIVANNTEDLDDKNLYAYCDNNPVSRFDREGNIWHWVAKVAIGLAEQYVGDVISNITSGKKGLDILKPTSSIGEYVSAGVTSLIPGSGFLHNVVTNVVSTSISCIEKKVRGKEINWHKEVKKTVVSIAIDTGVGKAIDKTQKYVSKKIIPRNYSTYKHQLSKRYPTITRQAVNRRMYVRGRVARGVNAGIGFAARSARAALRI